MPNSHSELEGREAAGGRGSPGLAALRAGLGAGTAGAPSSPRPPRAHSSARDEHHTQQLDGLLHYPQGILYRKGTQLSNYKEIILDTAFCLPVGPTYKYSL